MHATIIIFPNSPDPSAVGKALESQGYRIDPTTGRAIPSLRRAIADEALRLCSEIDRVQREFNASRRVTRSYIQRDNAPGRMVRVVDIHPGHGPNNVA